MASEINGTKNKKRQPHNTIDLTTAEVNGSPSPFCATTLSPIIAFPGVVDKTVRKNISQNTKQNALVINQHNKKNQNPPVPDEPYIDNINLSMRIKKGKKHIYTMHKL
jgi:hypothetical protein